METKPQGGMQISGGAPLYVKPEPLNPTAHGKLGLVRTDMPYNFATEQHFVPILVTEFSNCATSYPIIFAGDEKVPLAVMGLKPGENLFFPERARDASVYVPSYIRRYPFTVANSDNPEENRAIVCIDTGSDIIGENPVQPFFDKDGKFTEYTEHCVKFCQSYENERITTQNVVKRLRDLDLFEFRQVHYRPRNEKGEELEQKTIAGFHAISQDKLNALPAETYFELRDNGILTAIFAHWISQSNWDRLTGMSLLRASNEAKKSNGAGKKT
jgi:hypothetical protein